MVGGAPITKEFADEIGADGYSEDAASAAVLAKALAALRENKTGRSVLSVHGIDGRAAFALQ